jgi:VanZ family protein
MNRLGRPWQNPTLWLIALAGYWLALLIATHLPRDFPGVPSEHVDKVVHAATFALLGWLLATAWQRTAGRLTGRHLRAAWLAIVLYAAADELTQPWFGRTCALGDWLADAVGAVVGLALFAWQWKRRRH